MPKNKKNIPLILGFGGCDVLAYVGSRQHACPAHTSSLGKHNDSLLRARVTINDSDCVMTNDVMTSCESIHVITYIHYSGYLGFTSFLYKKLTRSVSYFES